MDRLKEVERQRQQTAATFDDQVKILLSMTMIFRLMEAGNQVRPRAGAPPWRASHGEQRGVGVLSMVQEGRAEAQLREGVGAVQEEFFVLL